MNKHWNPYWVMPKGDCLSTPFLAIRRSAIKFKAFPLFVNYLLKSYYTLFLRLRPLVIWLQVKQQRQKNRFDFLNVLIFNQLQVVRFYPSEQYYRCLPSTLQQTKSLELCKALFF